MTPARIPIIGSPGSGKSTFARALAAKTGLPLHHLDQLFWQPGWVETERAAFEARVAEVTAGESWIVDGNYSGTLASRLARAEQVILLDLSPFRCAWRLLTRIRRNRGKVREDMAPGCPERFDIGFFWYVLSFRLNVLPRLEAQLAHFHGDLLWLGRPREIARYLESGERLDQHGHE